MLFAFISSKCSGCQSFNSSIGLMVVMFCIDRIKVSKKAYEIKSWSFKKYLGKLNLQLMQAAKVLYHTFEVSKVVHGNHIIKR